MSRIGHGLVIGKFYPPHHGHKFLIDAACAQCERVTVIVCRRPNEDPPAELRAEWLREIHPTARVLMIEDTLDPDDSQAWAIHTRLWLGETPDAVFTSESYGDPYARFLGCKHVLVDLARTWVPCSGTQVRSRPLDWLSFLEPCVRAYYVLRVAVMGAESTGTTTLSEDLAERYQTAWVPEYGRDYWAARDPNTPPKTEEFIHIAAVQNQWEDKAAREANRVLICDTDSFATALWHERYVGGWSPEVVAISAGRRYAITLLTDVDIPFVQDGTRDGEHLRHGMHARFAEELARSGRRWALVSGSREARLAQAVARIEALLR